VIEPASIIHYSGSMNRSLFATSLAGSMSRLLNALDQRERPKRRSPQPGETVAVAWAATGHYLRNAMDRYDQRSSATSHPGRSSK
jgi:hypothetical protein